jgi:2-polyprenyl-6-methoxyphenol hydroxylase-like FAD-dependent oxidoreductase
MLFARAGYRVLMVDRARFPKDTLSTLYIQVPGVELLRQWGLLDAVRATGCPPITEVDLQVLDVRLTGRLGSPCCAPRRDRLDPILADAAVAAGVEFRGGCAVESVLFDGDRVVGVRCRTMLGTSDERARLVVGADGVNSLVAREVRAATRIERPSMTCVYYAFFAGLPAGFEMFGARGGWAGCVPTNDGLTLVAMYFPQTDFDRVRRSALESYLDGIRMVAPALFDRMRASRRDGRLYGTGDQRNYFRQGAGPGWALVGDAGHHKDSITAYGITDAFHQARLLADCVAADLDDEQALRAGLTRYAQVRDRLLAGPFRTTLRMARLTPDDHLWALRQFADDPIAQDRLLDTMFGTYPTDLVPAIR